jgi:protein tyrosine phosphatase
MNSESEKDKASVEERPHVLSIPKEVEYYLCSQFTKGRFVVHCLSSNFGDLQKYILWDKTYYDDEYDLLVVSQDPDAVLNLQSQLMLTQLEGYEIKKIIVFKSNKYTSWPDTCQIDAFDDIDIIRMALQSDRRPEMLDLIKRNHLEYYVKDLVEQ